MDEIQVGDVVMLKTLDSTKMVVVKINQNEEGPSADCLYRLPSGEIVGRKILCACLQKITE